MAMAAMNMVSAGGFLAVSFHLKRCPQGVAFLLCKKTPILGPTIEVRQPEGISQNQNRRLSECFHEDHLHFF
jgi:hypothetical protein